MFGLFIYFFIKLNRMLFYFLIIIIEKYMLIIELFLNEYFVLKLFGYFVLIYLMKR